MDFRLISTDDELYKQEFELRFQVLRKPLGHDRSAVRFAFEDESLHVVAIEAGRVIGCVLFAPDENGGGRLFQMAVSDWFQGQGVGRALVEHLEGELRAGGFERVEMHARDSAVGFYEALGYRCVGEPFEEVGIPHRIMEKQFEAPDD
jgi:ribosomal protein S18 acetylase RimI-like enzyme